MGEYLSFKARVKNEAILNASLYKDVYINFEYLVCSKAYSSGYKIIKADASNYLHLIGVNTYMGADKFFEKCIQGTLEVDDFDFKKSGQDEKIVKGSVRQKIKVLKFIATMFDSELKTEENFHKNIVYCAFATSDNACTLGFVAAGRPKSLMKSNELSEKAQVVDLIFRKERGSKRKYVDLHFGNKERIVEYKEQIKDLVDESLLL